MKNKIPAKKRNLILNGNKQINEIMSIPMRKQAMRTSYKSYLRHLRKVSSFSNIKEVISQIISHEQQHKHELEKLALESVLNLPEFELVKIARDKGEVEFDVKLCSEFIKPKQQDKKPKKDQIDVKKVIKQDILNNRKLINMFIQGGSFSKLWLFNVIDNPNIQAMNSQYNLLSTFAEAGYWQSECDIEDMTLQSGSAGQEQVVPFNDKYIIKATAICFPFLQHEIIKGIYEWLLLNKDTTKATTQDNVTQETEDILFGNGLYLNLIKQIEYKDINKLPVIIKKICENNTIKNYEDCIFFGRVDYNNYKQTIETK